MTKPPDLGKHVLEWLTYAEGDLRGAGQILRSDNPAWHTVCFLAQASAEKYCKAYLISRGWQLRKIHDLVELSEYAIRFDQDFSRLFPLARILNDYIEAGRYPGDLPFESIGKAEAEEALAAAEKTAEFVLAKLATA